MAIKHKFKNITYSGMTVKQKRDMLEASVTTSEPIHTLCEIIKNCSDLDPYKAEHILSEQLLLNIIAKTNGEMRDLTFRCLKCNTKFTMSINITESKIEGSLEKTYKTKSGDIVVYLKTPNLVDSLKYESSRTYSELLTNTLVYIDKIKTKEGTVDTIDDLPAKEWEEIVSYISKNHKRVALKVVENMPCINPECKEVHNITLYGLKGFFL